MDISYLYLIDSGNLTDMLSSETEKAFDDDIGEVKMNTIGERIRKYRKEKGFTQKELALKSGVHEVTISNYERGKKSSTPILSNLKKIAKALNIPVDFLLRDSCSISDEMRCELMDEIDRLEKFAETMVGEINLLYSCVGRIEDTQKCVEASAGHIMKMLRKEEGQ